MSKGKVKNKKKEYRNKKWFAFRARYFEKYGEVCKQCSRGKSEAVIQLHHTHYVKGRDVWDYDLEDMEALCKGCHAREHNILEPNSGWHLFSVVDLGGSTGKCERQKSLTSPSNNTFLSSSVR